MAKAVKAKTYEADDIEVITLDTEKVRRKPAFYLGVPPATNDGHHQTAKELVDNAFDEAYAGENDVVGFAIDAEGWHWVFDRGRGIPVEMNKKAGISTLTAVFCRLHAGGKLSKEQSAYKQGSRGTHGVGACVTNALSEVLEVYTFRNKKWYCQFYKKGIEKGPVKPCKGPPSLKGYKGTFDKGTVIRYKPDTTILAKNTHLDKKHFLKWFETQAYLCPKAKLFVVFDGKQQKFYQPKGLQSFIGQRLEQLKAEGDGRAFVLQSEAVDIALQWSSHPDEMVNGYVNGSPTSDALSTQLIGINRAITEALKAHKGAKAEYRAEDLRNGLVGAVNVSIQSPEFDSQSKSKLVSKEATEIVYNAALPALKKYFNDNKALAKRIINRATEVRAAHAQLQLSKKAAAELKGTRKGKVNLPGKLMQCSAKNPKDVEVFLVEGDSAKGTAQIARNQKFQEVLTLKGKPLNVFRDKKGAKTFENEEVMNILKTIGYDPGLKNPLQNLRVGKIVMLADPDADGYHINILTLSIFQKFLPELLEKGMVYVVDASLYVYKTGSEFLYGNSVKDLQAQLKGKTFNANNVTRIKGWGECPVPILRQMAFNPDTRRLIQIKPVKGKELAHFASIVSESPEMRRELLGLN